MLLFEYVCLEQSIKLPAGSETIQSYSLETSTYLLQLELYIKNDVQEELLKIYKLKYINISYMFHSKSFSGI